MLVNDLDPAPPRRNADEIALRVGDAVSMRRQGCGNCSGYQPSSCIDGIVREYSVTGKGAWH